MKIAILTSGILPVPAVQGGAVENLIDFYLEYNEHYRLHDITVFSIYHHHVEKHPALKSSVNHYKYINTASVLYKVQRKLFSLHNKGIYNYFIEFFFEKAYRLLSKNHYDLIILENRPGFAVKLSKRVSTPIVAHIHFDMLSNPAAEHIFDNIKGIICVSNYLYSNVSENIRRKCITVYNGIDNTSFSIKSDEIRSKLRHDYKLNDNDILLVYSGRIDPIKGVKELIDAIILTKNKNIKLMIIGSSSFSETSYQDDYSKLVYESANEIKDQIIFTGFQPYSKIPTLLSISDIAVIPSLCNDAFPTSILEAQASGLPIITTSLGGIPEQVTSDNAIILAPSNSFTTDLASAISLLAKDEVLRIKMRKAALDRAKRFSKDVYAESFFKAIESYGI